MATRQQLHEEVDALREDELNAAQIVISRNETGPSDSTSADDEMLAGHEAAIERLRANPKEWAAWQTEIALLDGTLSDGLNDL